MIRALVDYFIIKASGYFDPAYYLLNYPDCRRADVDPLWHFVRYGWKEGRNPSPYFNTEYYLKTNPDVQASGMNPFVHYLRFGRQEGRAPQQFSTDASPLNFSHHIGRANRRPSHFQKLLYRFGPRIYRVVPPKYRWHIVQWLYAHFGFLFSGMPDYEAWRGKRQLHLVSFHYNLIDLQTVEPAREAGGNIAIHLHVFYHDLAGELCEYLKNMPFPYDLYVSVSSEEALEVCRRKFTNLPLCRQVEIRKVPNRGRDIAPLLCTFGDELLRYNYIAHFHTKKSLYNKGATEGWREYLLQSLLGSRERIRRIFNLMQGKSPCGIVYPQNCALLPYWVNTWLANRESGRIWCMRLGITEIPRGYFDYPAGSMFWARTEALAPLFRAGITLNDFPEEQGQNDGTLAHTIERLFVLCSLSQGMSPGILRDETNPSWSPWRFDQYVGRPFSSLVDTLNSAYIQLIAFDIFDTLFCRPILNPETVKEIVARRIGGNLSSLYRRYRPVAEEQARYTRGFDVGLDEIYAEMGKLANLPEIYLKELQKVEQEVEEALLEPRWETVQLLKEAFATGKPVVLITDMFLPREHIERCLHKHNIKDWHDLFISSEIGLRKDTGRLYEYVLQRYAVKPGQWVMIGDNERSDAQIPGDMGATLIHLLKPVELARGLPRFSPLIANHEKSGDVDAEITLGLVVRKNFSPIYYPSFDPASLVQVTPYNIGYSIVGPLATSFASWLIKQARADKINKLYFLSREGRLLKEVYECWAEGLSDAPPADYLIISRRAAGVASITSFDDILDIAKSNYYSDTLENFLYIRYGLALDNERWIEIAERTGWDRSTPVNVQNEEIGHLASLLQILEDDILARVEVERSGLLQYLKEKGLTPDGSQAVVDVGYGGSVQGYLNRLLSGQVHGYYLMTDYRAPKVANAYGVIVRGCFFENVVPSPHMPGMYRYSFELERLLASGEPQIEYYQVDSAGKPEGHYRDLHPLEREADNIRKEIRRGALDYARDARYIREMVLPDFQPSLWTAQMLVEAFLTQRSRKESEFLSKIVLDDYYCGRGLVTS